MKYYYDKYVIIININYRNFIIFSGHVLTPEGRGRIPILVTVNQLISIGPERAPLD